MSSVNRLTAALAAAKPRPAGPPPAAFMARLYTLPAPAGVRLVWGVGCPDCGGYLPADRPATLAEYVTGVLAGGHGVERSPQPGEDWPTTLAAARALAAEAGRLLGKPVRVEVLPGPVARILPAGGWL